MVPRPDCAGAGSRIVPELERNRDRPPWERQKSTNGYFDPVAIKKCQENLNSLMKMFIIHTKSPKPLKIKVFNKELMVNIKTSFHFPINILTQMIFHNLSPTL